MGPGARESIATTDRQAPLKCNITECMPTQMNNDQHMSKHNMSIHDMNTLCHTSFTNMDQHKGIHSMITQDVTA